MSLSQLAFNPHANSRILSGVRLPFTPCQTTGAMSENRSFESHRAQTIETTKALAAAQARILTLSAFDSASRQAVSEKMEPVPLPSIQKPPNSNPKSVRSGKTAEKGCVTAVGRLVKEVACPSAFASGGGDVSCFPCPPFRCVHRAVIPATDRIDNHENNRQDTVEPKAECIKEHGISVTVETDRLGDIFKETHFIADPRADKRESGNWGTRGIHKERQFLTTDTVMIGEWTHRGTDKHSVGVIPDEDDDPHQSRDKLGGTGSLGKLREPDNNATNTTGRYYNGDRRHDEKNEQDDPEIEEIYTLISDAHSTHKPNDLGQKTDRAGTLLIPSKHDPHTYRYAETWKQSRCQNR